MIRKPLLILLYISIISTPCFADLVIRADKAPEPVSISGAYSFEGVNYVDIVALFDVLGVESFWNETSQKLVFKTKKGAGVISPRSPFISCGVIIRKMRSMPVFLDARLCVPFSFVKEQLAGLIGLKFKVVDFQARAVPEPFGLPYRPLYLKKIVLDPGHGGHDSGARSPSGLQEKDIVLQVSKRLARRLREEMGIDVQLTRDDDRFIPLGERARIGNMSGAQIFVSIHANGAFNKEATGTETFFLSFEASDRKTARLAAAENASLALERDRPMMGSEIDDLKTILWDLVATETMKDSEKLAIAVQSKLEQQLNLPSRGVKQAPFYVLMGTSIPAILVEIGFITTSEEAGMLADPAFQEHICNALFMALLNYDTLRAMESEQ